jgi:hypothetical protein
MAIEDPNAPPPAPPPGGWRGYRLLWISLGVLAVLIIVAVVARHVMDDLAQNANVAGAASPGSAMNVGKAGGG